MKAQYARFGIFLIALMIAFVIFMKMHFGWLSAALIGLVVISGGSISDLVFRRLADEETIRLDLEERVRDQHSG